MIKKILSISFVLMLTFPCFSQYDKWFQDKTLRVDFVIAGNKQSSEIYFDEMLEERFWGGSKKNLIDTFKMGEYYFEIRDKESNLLLYSRGFSTLFHEWASTEEAKTISKSFQNAVLFPYPKGEVKLIFFYRNIKGLFTEKCTFQIDPKNYFIKKERRFEYPTLDVHVQADPDKALDIVIIPDGYTAQQMDLFKADCKKFAEGLFQFNPYNKSQNLINIRAVLAPSKDEGADIPAENIWKNTQVGGSFYTLNSERYLMTTEIKKVRDLASNVPYDQIYILSNTQKYGGGAIYNFYSYSVNSNAKSRQIIAHEFGHAFAGLGDEYYTPGDPYSGLYPREIEPWEPNISTLADFDKKWKNMMNPKTPIPTPRNEQYADSLGVFEGGGYSEKGVYSPVQKCMMKAFDTQIFCPVCASAIEKMLKFYCE